jgi:hypothetical protein
MKKGTALATALWPCLARALAQQNPRGCPGCSALRFLWFCFARQLRASLLPARSTARSCLRFSIPVASIPLTTAQFLGVLGGMS